MASKRQTAEKLVERVFAGDAIGVISNQVLSEIFYVLTRRIGRPLGSNTALGIIRKYALSDKWTRVDYTTATAIKAASDSTASAVPFWDALIAETMKENGISKIITENEKDFRRIPGITAVNPFK